MRFAHSPPAIYITMIQDRWSGKRKAYISRGHSARVYNVTPKSHDRLSRTVNNLARAGLWHIEAWPYAHIGWLAKPLASGCAQ